MIIPVKGNGNNFSVIAILILFTQFMEKKEKKKRKTFLSSTATCHYEPSLKNKMMLKISEITLIGEKYFVIIDAYG